MHCKTKKKIFFREEEGVSDILANILILAITVALFSGVIYWVWAMPTPTQTTYVDMFGTLQPKNNYIGGAYINVTHRGGELLDDWATSIYITVDGSPSSRIPISSDAGVGDRWDTGEIWHYVDTRVTSSDKFVSIAVVDDARGVVVWSATLIGGAGVYPPMISELKVRTLIDSDWTVTTQVPRSNQFKVYAKVIDVDGDLETTSVVADLSALNSSWSAVTMTDADGDGVYNTASLTMPSTVRITYTQNGRISDPYSYIVKAYDSASPSHLGTSREYIDVIPAGGLTPDSVVGLVDPNSVKNTEDVRIKAFLQNPSGNVTSVKIVSSGWISETTLVQNSTNMALYDDPYSPRDAPAVTEDEGARTYLVYFTAYNGANVVTQDIVQVLVWWDQEAAGGGSAPTELVEEVYWIQGGQGFVITNNASSNQSVQIFDQNENVWIKIGSNLVDSYLKVNKLVVTDYINSTVYTPPTDLTDAFTYIGTKATYRMYRLNFKADSVQGFNPTTGGYYNVYMEIQDTDPTEDYFIASSWFIVKDSGGNIPFYPQIKTYSDSGYTTEALSFNSWNTIYVKVLTKTTGAANTVNIPNVLIKDFKGGTQVNNAIANGIGRGPVSNVGIVTSNYSFSINLLKADKDAWIFGRSAYTLYLNSFSDSNEYYEKIAKQLFITSPTSVLDVISGQAEAKGGTYADEYFGIFYENQGGYWDDYAYAFRSGTSGQTDTIDSIFSVSFADMDGDNDKDIVACLKGDDNKHSYLALWDQYAPRRFSRTNLYDYTTTNKEFCAVATGDIDYDGDYDIVAGTDDGIIYYFANDGEWDLTAIIDSTSVGVPGTANTNGGKGIAIADLDNDHYGEVIVGTSTALRIYKNNSGTYSTWTERYTDATVTSIASVAIGDVGYSGVSDNGRKDIVAGTTAGLVYCWLQTSITSFSKYTVEGTAHSGTNPAMVGIGNIETSSWGLDIVVGNGAYILLYSTTPASHGAAWSHINYDDSSANSGRPNAAGSPGTRFYCIGVGNVDGAIQDDIIGSLDNGRIYYYRNLGNGAEWRRFIVEDLNSWLGTTAAIYCIAIGDANIGN